MTNSNEYADVTAMFPGKDKQKRRYKDVQLPVAGITIRIQSLTGREVAKFQSATINKRSRRIIQDKMEDALARLVVL